MERDLQLAPREEFADPHLLVFPSMAFDVNDQFRHRSQNGARAPVNLRLPRIGDVMAVRRLGK